MLCSGLIPFNDPRGVGELKNNNNTTNNNGKNYKNSKNKNKTQDKVRKCIKLNKYSQNDIAE